MFIKEKKAVTLENTITWLESAKRNGPLERNGGYINNGLFTRPPPLLAKAAFSAMFERFKITKIMS